MYLAPREQTWQEDLGESKAPDFPLLGVGSESGKERQRLGCMSPDAIVWPRFHPGEIECTATVRPSLAHWRDGDRVQGDLLILGSDVN